ncbi:proteasome subunit alpha type-1-like [Drosophila obscura]|uniref:proteasome subunit alpha type-1-like n=1 Tax=Drosophila obscura TaxID=7282 RepID=UPI000BA13281|nr:proteasome subunit alpha type-1-like [Drosophila obscura]
MNRHRYDNDTTVFSPQGRIFQVEYAMEAVKKGEVTVGLKNKDFTVLTSLYEPSDEGSMQRKIIPVHLQLGMTFAGVAPDAKTLCRYMLTQALTYRYSYIGEMPVHRLMINLGNKMQAYTNRYDRRPFGAGLLVAGYDEQGSHLYQIMPSATVTKCLATAIGSRSQIARNYLELHTQDFEGCSKDDLICHGIQAIREPLGNENNLKIQVAIVGKDVQFKVFSEEETQKYLETAKRMAANFEPAATDDLLSQGSSDNIT